MPSRDRASPAFDREITAHVKRELLRAPAHRALRVVDEVVPPATLVPLVRLRADEEVASALAALPAEVTPLVLDAVDLLGRAPVPHGGSNPEELAPPRDIEQDDFLGRARRAAEEVALEVLSGLPLGPRLLHCDFFHPIAAAVATDPVEDLVGFLDGLDLEGAKDLGLLESDGLAGTARFDVDTVDVGQKTGLLRPRTGLSARRPQKAYLNLVGSPSAAADDADFNWN